MTRKIFAAICFTFVGYVNIVMVIIDTQWQSAIMNMKIQLDKLSPNFFSRKV